MVYFYDIWADLLQSCEVGDQITISGPKDIVFVGERGLAVDLVLIPDDSPNKLATVSIKHKNSILPEITIRSTNILEHADKLIKRQKTTHKLLPTSQVPASPQQQTGTPIVTRQFQS